MLEYEQSGLLPKRTELQILAPQSMRILEERGMHDGTTMYILAY